jgi:hypothetical protein
MFFILGQLHGLAHILCGQDNQRQLMRRNRHFCSVPLIGACWPGPLCTAVGAGYGRTLIHLVLLVFLHTDKIHEQLAGVNIIRNNAISVGASCFQPEG